MSLSSDNLKLIPFKTLIDPIDYWNLSVIFLIVGLCSMAYFFMYYKSFMIAIKLHTRRMKEVYQKKSLLEYFHQYFCQWEHYSYFWD